MENKDLPLADKELLDIYNQYKDLNSKIKELEEKQEDLKKKAKEWLAVENDVGAVDKDGKKLITLVKQTKYKLDTKLLKVNEPEIFNKYASVSETTYVKFN